MSFALYVGWFLFLWNILDICYGMQLNYLEAVWFFQFCFYNLLGETEQCLVQTRVFPPLSAGPFLSNQCLWWPACFSVWLTGMSVRHQCCGEVGPPLWSFCSSSSPHMRCLGTLELISTQLIIQGGASEDPKVFSLLWLFFSLVPFDDNSCCFGLPVTSALNTSQFSYQ